MLRRIISDSVAVMILMALAMPLSPVYAFEGFRVRDGNAQGGEQSPQKSHKQRETMRQNTQRDVAKKGKRTQRLSPEERNQLRRDIKDAGREIYTPRR